MILKIGMQHRGLQLYTVYINGDPWLTLFHFMTTSNGNFSIGRSENHEFSETNAVWDLKDGKCRQLIKKMNISEY